jgi:hypothetical protein
MIRKLEASASFVQIEGWEFIMEHM